MCFRCDSFLRCATARLWSLEFLLEILDLLVGRFRGPRWREGRRGLFRGLSGVLLACCVGG